MHSCQHPEFFSQHSWYRCFSHHASAHITGFLAYNFSTIKFFGFLFSRTPSLGVCSTRKLNGTHHIHITFRRLSDMQVLPVYLTCVSWVVDVEWLTFYVSWHKLCCRDYSDVFPFASAVVEPVWRSANRGTPEVPGLKLACAIWYFP